MPLAVVSALFMGLASPSADIGVYPISIDCGDGEPITANVDILALTKLEAVIQDMVANPTGENCSLTQGSAPNSTETRPFVLGSGSYHAGPCQVNFTVRAFRTPSGLHGAQRVTFPPDTPIDCGGPGTIRTNVTCLSIIGNVAQVKGIVTESSGGFNQPIQQGFPNPDFSPEGSVFATDAQDNIDPSPDMVEHIPPPYADPADACAAQLIQPFPLDRGHIEVSG